MGLKSTLIKPFAQNACKKISTEAKAAVAHQSAIFKQLISVGARTAFGKDHGIEDQMSLETYQARVPVQDYEAFRPFVERIKQGEKDILWQGLPKYLATTSGTTSGMKYIPITKESLPNHIKSTRLALFNFAYKSNTCSLFDGKVIFLSGSPELDMLSGIPTGRLSGIVNHEIPLWLRRNQLPTLATNSIDDWNLKIEAIVKETVQQDMRLISGIPPWVKDYYVHLLDYTKKDTIMDIFPNYELFVYGGVNYEPYRANLENLVGKSLPSLELYPASEGFIAFQDEVEHQGMLLNTNSGIFFEFVPLDDIDLEHPRRLSIEEVELGIAYALVLTTNAGLWSYTIGDIVEFVDLDPYRIRVAGRTKHYISAFGEHVIGKEVDEAMQSALRKCAGAIAEFSVAPLIGSKQGEISRHDWFVEFIGASCDSACLAKELDKGLRLQNKYYDDLRASNMLVEPKIWSVRPGGFAKYMENQGKQGGQNKVPRLQNDRKLVEQLELV